MDRLRLPYRAKGAGPMTDAIPFKPVKAFTIDHPVPGLTESRYQ